MDVLSSLCLLLRSGYSLLLRVEAVAVLSSSAFKYDDYHSSTCEEDSGCRSASKDFLRTILADYFVHDYYYDSIMLAITSLEDKKEKDVLKMKEGCVKKALAFWEQKKVAVSCFHCLGLGGPKELLPFETRQELTVSL